MNIHHLELFYYVARHRGVSAAARRIPYSVQQPAISAQIIQLEDNLGTTLFHRRPFQLTQAGEQLYAFIQPFFSGLDEMGRRLRGGAAQSLRIGAIETVQRDYLPRLLRAMRRRHADLSFRLIPARAEEVDAMLRAQEIDLGIAPLLGKAGDGIKQKEIIRVPMALLVRRGSPLRSLEQVWAQDRIAEPLISGPADELVCRLFQQELRRRKVDWFPSIELRSQALVERYVAEGFGVGLVIVEPGIAPPVGTRALPLHDFPFIPYGVRWAGILSPLQKALIEEAEILAADLRR